MLTWRCGWEDLDITQRCGCSYFTTWWPKNPDWKWVHNCHSMDLGMSASPVFGCKTTVCRHFQTVTPWLFCSRQSPVTFETSSGTGGDWAASLFFHEIIYSDPKNHSPSPIKPPNNIEVMMVMFICPEIFPALPSCSGARRIRGDVRITAASRGGEGGEETTCFEMVEAVWKILGWCAGGIALYIYMYIFINMYI